jgi:hypothetical protein
MGAAKIIIQQQEENDGRLPLNAMSKVVQELQKNELCKDDGRNEVNYWVAKLKKKGSNKVEEEEAIA